MAIRPIPYYKTHQVILYELLIPTLVIVGIGFALDHYLWKLVLKSILEIPKIGKSYLHSPLYPILGVFHQLLFIVPLFLIWTFLTWQAQGPGLGRALLRLFGMGTWDLFPPTFSYASKEVQEIIARVKAKDPSARVIGFYKRFTCDLEQERKEGKNPGGPGDYWPIVLSFDKELRYRHVQLVGSTGSGKSASVIAPLLYQDGESSEIATFTINPKSDTYLIKCIISGVLLKVKNKVGEGIEPENGAQAPPTALISMVRKDSLAYDPLIYGTADTCTKKIIGSMEFDSSYYKGVQETWLMTFFRVVKTEPALNNRIMLRHLHTFLMNPMLLQTKLKPLVTMKENLDRIDALSIEDKKNLSGVAAHIATMVEDESLSHIFDNPTGHYLDLRAVINQGGNIFVEVDTNAKGSQSRALGRMLIMELQLLASARQSGQEPLDKAVMASIDEFGSFAYNGVIEILDKARSAHVGFLVAHQSVGNFKRSYLHPGFKDEVVDNTRTKFLLDIKDETSKWASDLMGEQRMAQITKSQGTSSSGTAFSRTSKNTSTREDWEARAVRDWFNLPLGKGFAQIQDEFGRLINCPITLGYLPDSVLCSDEDMVAFLKSEAQKHPRRPLNGSLIDNAVPFELPPGIVATSMEADDLDTASNSVTVPSKKPVRKRSSSRSKDLPDDAELDVLNNVLT